MYTYMRVLASVVQVFGWRRPAGSGEVDPLLAGVESWVTRLNDQPCWRLPRLVVVCNGCAYVHKRTVHGVYSMFVCGVGCCIISSSTAHGLLSAVGRQVSGQLNLSLSTNTMAGV